MAEPSPFGPGNPERPSLRYVFLRFLRYGLLAWGGPVAQIALMHRELVERDGWVDEARFRKVLALYQALPGPEAMELAVYFGMIKRGRLGGLLGGLGFMLPGVLFVTALAALYVHVPEATTGVGGALLYGVKPAVVALLAVGFARLATASITTLPLGAVAAAAAVVGVAAPGVPFLALLVVGGLAALLLDRDARRAPPAAHALLPLPLLLVAPALTLAGLGALALVGLKGGLLSFGGAYTAIPFFHDGAVREHGWITDAQFLDAVALSGLVPGPLIAIGTFVGYLAGGLPGAAVMTVAVFLPAFAFTLAGHDLFERIVNEPRLHAFLLGVTAAVIGLILVAVVPLGRAALVDVPAAAIAIGAAAALHVAGLRIPVVLVGAAVAGLALRALAGLAA